MLPAGSMSVKPNIIPLIWLDGRSPITRIVTAPRIGERAWRDRKRCYFRGLGNALLGATQSTSSATDSILRRNQ